jgi:hypothetical protein
MIIQVGSLSSSGRIELFTKRYLWISLCQK